MKKLLIMLLLSTLANAQVKTHYTDFYYDDDYLFSLIQVWEQQDKAGEPFPLPWKVTGYIHGNKTGLERLYATDKGIGWILEAHWLKPSTWKQFSDLNNLPNSILMTKDLETLVYLRPIDKDAHLVAQTWYITPQILPMIDCININNQCGSSDTQNPLVSELLYYCDGIYFGSDEYSDFLKCLEEQNEKYESHALFRELVGGKQFVTHINLYKNRIKQGIDEKGVQPYMPIY